MVPHTTHESDMRDLMELPPRKPLLEPDTEPISVLASLEEDIYVLERLVYDGDRLEGRMKQKTGCSLDPGNDGEEVQRPFDKTPINHLLAPTLAGRAEYQRQGRRPPLFQINTRLMRGASLALPIAFAPHAWGDKTPDAFAISSEDIQAAATMFGPNNVHGIPEALMQMMHGLSGFQ